MDSSFVVQTDLNSDITTMQTGWSPAEQKHLDDISQEYRAVHEGFGRSDETRVITHVVLLILFLSISALLMVVVTHFVIKWKRKKIISTSNSKTSEPKINLGNYGIEAEENSSKNKNLLLIQLDSEILTTSNKIAPSFTREMNTHRLRELPTPPKTTSNANTTIPLVSNDDDASKQHHTGNLTIGCCDEPDSFLASLSSPKRNYEELLDELLPQQHEEQPCRLNSAPSRHQQTYHKKVKTPTPTEHVKQQHHHQERDCQSPLYSNLVISNKPQTPNRSKVVIGAQTHYTRGPNWSSSITTQGRNNTHGETALTEPTTPTFSPVMPINTTSMKSQNNLSASTNFSIHPPHRMNTTMKQAPGVTSLLPPHPQQSPPHEYDPVYVPRHDSIAILKRIDNETSYITNRRLRNNMAASHNDSSGNVNSNSNNSNSSNNNNNIERLLSIDHNNNHVHLHAPQNISLHSIQQQFISSSLSSPLSPSSSSSSPTTPPAIPLRISSKHSNHAATTPIISDNKTKNHITTTNNNNDNNKTNNHITTTNNNDNNNKTNNHIITTTNNNTNTNNYSNKTVKISQHLNSLNMSNACGSNNSLGKCILTKQEPRINTAHNHNNNHNPNSENHADPINNQRNSKSSNPYETIDNDM